MSRNQRNKKMQAARIVCSLVLGAYLVGGGYSNPVALGAAAEQNASNVASYSVEWGKAIGTGVLADGNKELITGGTVWAKTHAMEETLKLLSDATNELAWLTAGFPESKTIKQTMDETVGNLITYVDGESAKLDEKVGAAADAIAASNGRIKALEDADFQGQIDDLTDKKLDKSEFNSVKTQITDAIDASKDRIKALEDADFQGQIDDLTDKKANKDMDNLTDAGKKVVKGLAKESINVVGDGPVSVAKSDVDGVDTYTVAVKTDGKVESANTGIVTGGTVYNEVRPTDGNYVMAANTTAANLTALDIEVKANADAIGATADGNYVSSTDSVGANLNTLDNQVNQNAKDIKANTDSINGLDSRVTQNTNDIADLKAGTGAELTAVNHRIDNVDSKINKVGAGAAALAALHPMDTDNKFSMAAGFGNYRDANAMALGMFYRPNDRVMFSMGGSLGNGENLLNVGVSFALDKGKGTSKAAMARTINALAEENKAIRAENAEQKAEIQELKEALARIEAKLAK